MVNKAYFFIAVVIVTAVIGLFIVWHESEADKVKKMFGVIAHSVGKTDRENPIVSAGKIKQIRAVLADTCDVDIPSLSFQGGMSSREITNYIYAKRMHFESVSLEFHDLGITFLDEIRANVSFTAVLKGKLTTGEWVEDVHESTGVLEKKEGQWILNRVEIVEILEK